MATITASASPAMQEAANTPSASPPHSTAASPARYRPSPLVIFSACLVLIGSSGPLLPRVYFVRGGQRLWLSALVQISGWPLLLPPLCVSLFRGRHHGIVNLLLPPRLIGAAVVLGSLYAVSCFVYAMGSQALPLSTSSLLLATQLAFTAVFAFLFVGLRFTPFSANAVVLLTIGPAVLGVGPGYGKPPGELLPLSEVLAVIFLHEKFDGPKGIALVLCLWGFASYMYGEKVQQKKAEAQRNLLLQQQMARKTGDLELANP